MKTTQNNPNGASRNDEDRLLLQALRLVAFQALCFLLGVAISFLMFGCRSQRLETSASVSTETAAINAGSSDSIRTMSAALVESTEIAAGNERELTSIHIRRDSAGRPTDILIDSSKTAGSRKATASSAATVSESSGRHEEKATSRKASEATEAKPVRTEDHSTARTAAAVAFFALVAFLGIGLFRRLRK